MVKSAASNKSEASLRLAAPLQQVDRTFVLHRGRKLSYFGGCDYYRLSTDLRVRRAVHRAIDNIGLNVAASRGTTGNHEIYSELERALAKFFHAESAVVVGSGYAANIVAAQALAGRFSAAVLDERSHASVKDSLSYLGCPSVTFTHRSPAALADRLRVGSPDSLILLTDGMFSHDGSSAPLAEYRAALPREAWMLVDDAHGAGVLGPHGGGAVEYCGIPRQRVIQTISLAKAFGVYGGAVLCPRSVRDDIVARSRLFHGNTPLPLPLAAGALEAVRLLGRRPALRERMKKNADTVKKALRSGGLNVPDYPGPIVAIIPGDAAEAGRSKRQLIANGVFPSLIRYAGGPPQGYFRFMISSEHSRGQLDALCRAIT